MILGMVVLAGFDTGSVPALRAYARLSLMGSLYEGVRRKTVLTVGTKAILSFPL